MQVNCNTLHLHSGAGGANTRNRGHWARCITIPTVDNDMCYGHGMKPPSRLHCPLAKKVRFASGDPETHSIGSHPCCPGPGEWFRSLFPPLRIIPRGLLTPVFHPASAHRSLASQLASFASNKLPLALSQRLTAMDSDDSTRSSQLPRLADPTLLMSATGDTVVNSSRSVSPHPVELADTLPGAGTSHGDGAAIPAGPGSFVPAKAELTLTADSTSSTDTCAGKETFLDQPRLFYTYPSYPSPPGCNARSAYHALVKDKTNVQITTTASYLMRVLGLRVSLSKPDFSAHPRYDDVVITASELRALYMKALVWFVERECLDEGSCQIVFVGGVDTNSPDGAPAIPLNNIREMADQLPEDCRDADSADDFDAFMFHAGAFFVEKRGWLSTFLIGSLIIAAAVTFTLIVPSLFTLALGNRVCSVKY
ncbi:hypothetical protein C8T65DRAFT_747085 [Cerioporus squamosus]|nr:hypothetical protein C8T65DRAFT_747085 [Cerioporus squamosus]